MNLESLIHAKLEGEITPEQHNQLEVILRDDCNARRLYLELADQHAYLLLQPAVNTSRLKPSSIVNRTGWWRTSTLIASAAAIVLMAFVIWPAKPVNHEATSVGAAMLSKTLDAEFSQATLRSGETLAPGTITLNKGIAQIEFFSGATALIEGAAQIQIISAWEARCLSGRVRVHVPPAAKGFLMHAPDVKLEDLGTEFALNVNGTNSQVHVFDGEVIAHRADSAPASLKAGMSLTSTKTEVSPQDFLPISEIQELIHQRGQKHFEAWQTWSLAARKDPRLVAYYPFKQSDDDKWDRMVNSLAEPVRNSRNGGAVGARWTQGRWPEKKALEFKRPGDRVRLNLDGAYNALTLACWVKVDSVDKKYNGLLLTDGYDNGEPHWQIHEDGSLMFSIIYRPPGITRSADWNQIYYSKPVFSPDSLGRWHHIAVIYDTQSGQVIQYFDGVEVSREVSKLHQAGRLVSFGPCELGNWGLPTPGHPFPIRNLNGAIDEFAIYEAVLSGAEIQTMFQQGKP
ncbi:MAG: LamG-like jellyroll fold domain-containing protein [Verrucomicrobiota bacterium]